AAKKIEEGVYTDFRDTVSAAWTGHDYSYQDKPVRENCQTVELDEFPKAFENENVFTRLKGFFSLKDGDVMPGTDKRVFSGRVMFASGNIGQHHGAKRFPPALEREFEVIPVDYPEMSIKNPELYVFMLLALIEKGHIQASKTELSPGYTKRDMSDDEKEVLSDGSVAIAKDELIEDPADKKHGFLYRLSYAVKAVQDAYMARGGENSYIDYTQRDLLRFKDSEDGSMYVDEGGEMRVLGTTITLNDISGWMIGYNAQLKKKKSLALPEYLQEKLKEKTQSKHEDEEILKAIFNYFGLLDKVMSDKGAKPLTPKEIGYLSPRVPRPVYVEKSETGKDEGKEPSEISAAEAEIYETKQVLLESGTKILMKEGEFSIDKKIVVNIGDKFIVNNESFVFAGTVEDQSSEQNDKLVGQFANGEKLYKIFNVEEVDFGIVENFKNIIGKTGIDDMEKIFINYWEIQGCVKQQGKIVFQK
ncbi:hypothetical protein KKB40_00830, partial [Patescibacteria group bacterium]|nr:hypothetical protein [Patescibacteria group bacterium]